MSYFPKIFSLKNLENFSLSSNFTNTIRHLFVPLKMMKHLFDQTPKQGLVLLTLKLSLIIDLVRNELCFVFKGLKYEDTKSYLEYLKAQSLKWS